MSRKMIDYQVENGKISTIDGYSVGGDEITGQVLLDNITQAKRDDGFSYSLSNDGKLIIQAAGRYEYKAFNVLINLHVSAGTYDVGDVVSLNSSVSISKGYFLGMTNDINPVLPLKENRVEGQPVWKLEMYPTYNGKINIIARSIKAGTLPEYKNYGDMQLKYTALYYGNYE